MRAVVVGSVLLLSIIATASAVMAQPALPAPTKTEKTEKTEGVLRANWAALLKSGCDLKAQGVGIPIDARVLRNTPFAMKGRAFASPDLAALFGKDGGWYVADPKANPTFVGAELACIDKLKKHEDALRKQFAIDAAFEARFTANVEAVATLREVSLGFQSTTLKMKAYTSDTEQNYIFTEKACKASDECSAIGLMCNADQCVVVAAG